MADDLDHDLIFDMKAKIWTAVHDLVDEMLRDVPDAEAEEIRQDLTSEFRFWKR